MVEIKMDGLIGREFVHGSTDCYAVMRDFYRLNFGLSFPDVARPDNWWEPDPVTGKQDNIYMDGFRDLGFEVVHEHPRLWRPADVILMAIKSTVANHGGILLPNSMMLHHLYGQRSVVETYNRPLFRDTTLAVIRHREVDGRELEDETLIDAWDLVPQRIKEKIGDARPQRP